MSHDKSSSRSRSPTEKQGLRISAYKELIKTRRLTRRRIAAAAAAAVCR